MEIWRGIPSHTNYEASNLGQIRRVGELRCLKLANSYGYLSVSLDHKKRLVHHLVLEAFVGPRPVGAITRHLNGVPSDNRLENLSWGTPAENNADAVAHGVGAGKLAPIHIAEILRLYALGISTQQLADRFGVLPNSVRYHLRKARSLTH